MSLTPLAFFSLRSPLLPFDCLKDTSVIDIQRFYQDPVLQEAIFIASPIFYSITKTLWEDHTSVYQLSSKVIITLYKYLIRMSYRCTPFGLFSGVATGIWNDSTNINLGRLSDNTRHNQLDINILAAIATKALQLPNIIYETQYYPNNTIYKVGDAIRYIESNSTDKVRTHQLVNVLNSNELDHILTLAEKGAKFLELSESLTDDQISNQEASDFIIELIQAQLLTSEIKPRITEENNLERIITLLKKYNSKPEFVNELEILSNNLNILQHSPLGAPLDNYSKIISQLNHLDISVPTEKYFSVDMSKSLSQKSLNRNISTELTNTLTILSEVLPYYELPELTEFKKDFLARYDKQEVALTEVLDKELGLGYPSSDRFRLDRNQLLDDFYASDAEEIIQSHEFTSWDHFLLAKYTDSIQSGSSIIQLTPEELEPFKREKQSSLPTSLYSIIHVLSPSAQDIDRGNFLIFHRLTAGPSSANLLGRFCKHDDELLLAVREALMEEEQSEPNKIFAEIVHWNQPRTGNILTRPVLRKYEIPIVSQSNVCQDHTILLNDIMVSVKEDRLVLRSKRLNQEIVPRLSTAHNYSLQTLPHYYFLCDLQYQNIRSDISWDWRFLNHAGFLPQVRLHKTIISKAKWLLKKTEYADIEQVNEPLLAEQFLQLRRSRHLPQWVSVGEEDNYLPLDLENALARQTLKNIFKGKEKIILEECLFNDSNIFLEGEGNKFTNELIVPLINRTNDAPPLDIDINQKRIDFTGIERVFQLGSEWLYIKLHSSNKTADKVLEEIIKPLTDKLIHESVIDRWFFIRYHDPESHLRIRFHGKLDNNNERFFAKIIQELELSLQSYTSSGIVRNVNTDTYNRELERYAYAGMAASENLFFYDSIAVTKLIKIVRLSEKDSTRWLLALQGTDVLLTDFGLGTELKLKIVNRLQLGYKAEFKGLKPTFWKILNRKYYSQRKEIEMSIESTGNDKIFEIARSVFEERSNNWYDTIQQIKRNLSGQPAETENAICSYIHMFLNRLLLAQLREHELYIYHFLFKYYDSLLARKRNSY